MCLSAFSRIANRFRMCYYTCIMELKKNSEYIAEIEAYGSEAQGIARIDGRAVFVPGAICGETWRLRILKVTNTAVYAKAMECRKASPERIDPGCPAYGKCGGCDARHMSYEEELRFKLRKVNDALSRIGRQSVCAEEILSCASPERYRNKAVFNIGLSEGKPAFGFYRERSHDLIPLRSCRIQMPLGEAVSACVTEFMSRYGFLPFDEATGKGTVRHVFCRSAIHTGDAVACIITARGFGDRTETLVSELREKCPELTGIVLCINKNRLNSVLSGSYYTLFGSDTMREILCGHEFRIAPQAFFQINPPQAEKLYERAVSYASCYGSDLALELYCGAGTISLSLAEKFQKVIAAEIVPEAIENAGQNAELNHISNVEFFCGDAGETAERILREEIRPDCVVVDPPRKGMEEAAVNAVASIGPKGIVYVSCDPATLARDILRFEHLGYRLQEACAVDMFPRTCHVETVCCLSRM